MSGSFRFARPIDGNYVHLPWASMETSTSGVSGQRLDPVNNEYLMSRVQPPLVTQLGWVRFAVARPIIYAGE